MMLRGAVVGIGRAVSTCTSTSASKLVVAKATTAAVWNPTVALFPSAAPAPVSCAPFGVRLASAEAEAAPAGDSASVSFPSNLKFATPSSSVTPAEKGEPLTQEVKVVPVVGMADGSERKTITLDNRVFGVPLRQDLAHRVVRWQLAKRRTTAYKTKGIGETRGGGKKPFPQKGTGRARTGSIRAAQWRGGNKAPGVVLRDWTLKLPKKVRAAGLRVALAAKYYDRRLTVLDEFATESYKTRDILPILSNHPWFKTTALVIYGDEIDAEVFLACRNFKNINILPAKGANVYDIVRHENLVLTESAVEILTARLAK